MKVNIIADAIGDAVRDVNGTSWSMVGYFLNYIGSNSTRQNITPIPTGRLIGKSPEYVEAYTTNYQSKQAGTMSDAEVNRILCMVGCVIGGCFMINEINNQIEDSLSGCGTSF